MTIVMCQCGAPVCHKTPTDQVVVTSEHLIHKESGKEPSELAKLQMAYGNPSPEKASPGVAIAQDGGDVAMSFTNQTHSCAVACSGGVCAVQCAETRKKVEDVEGRVRKLESAVVNQGVVQQFNNPKGGEQDMETISQGTSGPVAVVGKNDGPYWSAFGASEAALAILNYSGQARTDAAVFSHFLRDSVERRSDIAELRAEIRDVKNGQKDNQPDPVTTGLLQALVAALTKTNGS